MRAPRRQGSCQYGGRQPPQASRGSTHAAAFRGVDRRTPALTRFAVTLPVGRADGVDLARRRARRHRPGHRQPPVGRRPAGLRLGVLSSPRPDRRQLRRLGDPARPAARAARRRQDAGQGARDEALQASRRTRDQPVVDLDRPHARCARPPTARCCCCRSADRTPTSPDRSASAEQLVDEVDLDARARDRHRPAAAHARRHPLLAGGRAPRRADRAAAAPARAAARLPLSPGGSDPGALRRRHDRRLDRRAGAARRRRAAGLLRARRLLHGRPGARRRLLAAVRLPPARGTRRPGATATSSPPSAPPPPRRRGPSARPQPRSSSRWPSPP